MKVTKTIPFFIKVCFDTLSKRERFRNKAIFFLLTLLFVKFDADFLTKKLRRKAKILTDISNFK